MLRGTRPQKVNTSKNQQILLRFDLLEIDARHLPQIVDGFEIAVVGALLQNGRRFRPLQQQQRLQLHRRCFIDFDR